MAISEPGGGEAGPTLSCLGGNAAPAALQEAWHHLTGLPEAARADLWQVLAGAIGQPEGTDVRSAVEALAGRHEVPPVVVSRALETGDVLLAGAASLNLTADTLAQDLTALAGGTATAPVGELVRCYEQVQPLLRARLVEATLADHGKVLTGLDWRVDNVTAADRGVVAGTTVVYLTLRYREGAEEGRLSLQLTPTALRHLKAFTDRFGG